jgi:hypothetical protein
MALGYLLQDRSGSLRLPHNLRLLPCRPLPPQSDNRLAQRLGITVYLHPIHLRLQNGGICAILRGEEARGVEAATVTSALR